MSWILCATHAQEQKLRAKRLQATQQAIAKILVIYSGKVHAVDLSRTDLSKLLPILPPSGSGQNRFIRNSVECSKPE